MTAQKKVLFVCYGNACRSQMAEAIARHVAADVIEPSSAGLVPFGEVPKQTLAVLSERGISAEGQQSKPLSLELVSEADLVVNMSGSPGSAIFGEDAMSIPVEDWSVGDPYGTNVAVYRAIRDEIEARVEDLAQRLRGDQGAPGGA